MKFKFSIKLATISLIGNIIIAIGVSTCRISQMGIDPFTSMTTGISSLLNIPLGVFQGSVNAILFLILILLSRSNLKYLNIGAIINMFLLGFFVSIYMADVMSPSYPVCRIMTDVVCVLIGFITGGPLGIATIILMFGTGPLISTWNKLVSKPIVEKFA